MDNTVKRPLQMDAHLAKMSRLIADDPVAGAVVPDLEGLLRNLIAELDTMPRSVELDDGRQVWLTGFGVRRIAAGTITRRQFLRLIPAELGPVLNGDYRALADIAAGGSRIRISPMRGAVDCASGVSANRWALILQERSDSLLGEALDFPYPDACDAWRVDDLGDEFRAPVSADLPVLFISGPLDGNTPIQNAEEVRRGFPNSGHIVVELMGHEGPGLWFGAPRVMDLVGEFLAGTPPPSETVSAAPIDWEMPARSP